MRDMADLGADGCSVRALGHALGWEPGNVYDMMRRNMAAKIYVGTGLTSIFPYALEEIQTFLFEIGRPALAIDFAEDEYPYLSVGRTTFGVYRPDDVRQWLEKRGRCMMGVWTGKSRGHWIASDGVLVWGAEALGVSEVVPAARAWDMLDMQGRVDRDELVTAVLIK